MNAREIGPVLLVHGGAGVIEQGIDSSKEAIQAALRAALQCGYARLRVGDSALDAVSTAVAVLEDAPYFNAGRGAVFTHEGENELDAAIMDGATLRAGAIAGVRHVRNPVLLARAVMERSPHVLLIGRGAEMFAQEQGLEFAGAAWFRTEERWQQLQDALKFDGQGEPGIGARCAESHLAPVRARARTCGTESGRGTAACEYGDRETHHLGTVGAVALDARGNLAAATSTGGMTAKRWGRVGDSPVIGAGTYANARCAVSCTGWGEFYIRACAAHAICMRVSELHQPVSEAAEAMICREIPQLGGSGGAIALGADGSFALPFNTPGMYRGWIDAEGEPHVAIWDD